MNSECDDIDGFSHFIAKAIKAGEITKDSLKTKSHKTKKDNKNKVTTFEETKDQQLKSYNDAIELDNDNLTL